MATPLTFWHARILLLMTPEPQSITDVATHLTTQGKTFRLSRLEAILEDLKNRELLGDSPREGSVERHYWLRSGVLVEDGLHEAYTLVTGRQEAARRKPRMTAPPLTFWQARILLLLTLESQSVNEVADRIAMQGTLLDPPRVQQLLKELHARGLLKHTPKKGHTGGRYALGSGPPVEDALDQAHEIVTTQSP